MHTHTSHIHTYIHTKMCGQKGGKRSLSVTGRDERRVLDAYELVDIHAYIHTYKDVRAEGQQAQFERHRKR